MGKGPCHDLGKVRTVAWVIVVGDGFCNIVDGLTSAASFSVSMSKGQHSQFFKLIKHYLK